MIYELVLFQKAQGQINILLASCTTGRVPRRVRAAWALEEAGNGKQKVLEVLTSYCGLPELQSLLDCDKSVPARCTKGVNHLYQSVPVRWWESGNGFSEEASLTYLHNWSLLDCYCHSCVLL